jgi:integrase
VWRIVRDIATAAGVSGVSPHVLRHTAATHMARRGVPLWTIAKVLANTLAMVERVYAKHSPDDLRVAVGMISGGALVAAE